jgi:hypothetical protein
MQRRSSLLASLLLAGALAVPTLASASLHAGNVAPDFRGTALDGFNYHLSDFRGQVVVLFVLGSS